MLVIRVRRNWKYKIITKPCPFSLKVELSARLICSTDVTTVIFIIVFHFPMYYAGWRQLAFTLVILLPSSKTRS